MKLSEWAHVAEIVASVVIVVSLAYVGLELSQNTLALQQSAYQDTFSELASLDLALAQDAELHRIVSKGQDDPEQLNEEEWSRFTHFNYPRLGVWEYLFLSKNEGGVSQSQWRAFEPYFINLFCKPGHERFFRENRESYSSEFVEYVEDEFENKCTHAT